MHGKSVRWEWHSIKTGRTYDLFDTPIMGPDGTVCKLQFIRDISDRKRAERALRQSEKLYRTLVETLNEGLGVQDENGLWVYVNDQALRNAAVFQGGNVRAAVDVLP